MTHDPIGHRVAKGAGWMVMFKLVERLLGVISTLVLARLLVPADFGLVAMAMAFAGILDVLTSFSFDLALIQNNKAERRHYDTAFTFNVLAGALLSLVLYVSAGAVADFYKEPAVKGVLEFLALCFLVQGFQNIGVVAFQKDLELHKEFSLGVAKKLVQVLVGVGAALYLRNYWALLIGILTSRLVGVFLSYVLHPYRPRFSLGATRELLRFSSWMLANNVVIFLNNKGIDFIVGRLAGANALGLYSVSYEISNLPTTELVFPVSRAVFPGYATVAHDRDQLRTLFLQVLAMTALVAIPIGFMIAAFADTIVFVLLGDKWNAAAPLVGMLAIYGVVRALHGGTGSVYLAIGKPHLVGVVNAIIAIVSIPLAIFALLHGGIAWVPYTMLCAGLLAAFVNFHICNRVLEIGWFRLASAMARASFGTAIALAIVYLSRALLAVGAEAGRNIGADLALAAAYVAAYVATVLLIWHLSGRPAGAEATLLAALRRLFFGRHLRHAK